MSVYEDVAAGVYVKRTAGARRVGQFQAEANMVRVAAHPGVVELLDSVPIEPDGWELHFRSVPGGDLTARSAWTVEEVAGFGAALVTTVADLHDLGIVHGRIAADHVLVDDRGRPVLCGFGRARRFEPSRESDPRRADVEAVASCLRHLLPSNGGREVAKVLDRARQERRRAPTARQLARALGEAVADPCLPGAGPDPVAEDAASPGMEGRGDEDSDTAAGSESGVSESGVSESGGGKLRTVSPGPSPRAGVSRARRLPVLAVVAGLAVVVALGVGSWAVAGQGAGRAGRSSPRAAAASPLARRGPRSPRRPPPPPAAGPACPAVDAGCRPISRAGDLLVTAHGRYRIGSPADVTVLGRWTCRTSLPALLEPATGRVWVFDGWPGIGRSATARLVATVAGARSLRVTRGGGSCDHLEVLRTGAAPVVVALGATS